MIRFDATIVDPMRSFEKYDIYDNQLANKYYGGEIPENSQRRSEKVHRVIMILEPTDIVAWDYRKVEYPS